MIEQFLPTIVIGLIGGLLGIIVKGLSSEIKSMHSDLKEMVTKEMCQVHREKIEGDVNNIGLLLRQK